MDYVQTHNRQNQDESYNGRISNRFHVLFEQRNFTRQNFQRHAQPQHHGNYMTGYDVKHTSRKCQKVTRQSLAKHVNAKP